MMPDGIFSRSLEEESCLRIRCTRDELFVDEDRHIHGRLLRVPCRQTEQGEQEECGRDAVRSHGSGGQDVSAAGVPAN